MPPVACGVTRRPDTQVLVRKGLTHTGRIRTAALPVRRICWHSVRKITNSPGCTSPVRSSSAFRNESGDFPPMRESMRQLRYTAAQIDSHEHLTRANSADCSPTSAIQQVFRRGFCADFDEQRCAMAEGSGRFHTCGSIVAGWIWRWQSHGRGRGRGTIAADIALAGN